jgi:hypothetical protein
MPDTKTIPQVGSVWSRPHTDMRIVVTDVFTAHGRTQVAYDVEYLFTSEVDAGQADLDRFLAFNVEVPDDRG